MEIRISKTMSSLTLYKNRFLLIRKLNLFKISHFISMGFSVLHIGGRGGDFKSKFLQAVVGVPKNNSTRYLWVCQLRSDLERAQEVQ